MLVIVNFIVRLSFRRNRSRSVLAQREPAARPCPVGGDVAGKLRAARCRRLAARRVYPQSRAQMCKRAECVRLFLCHGTGLDAHCGVSPAVAALVPQIIWIICIRPKRSGLVGIPTSKRPAARAGRAKRHSILRGLLPAGAGLALCRAKEEGRILSDPAFRVKPLAMTYSCMA